VETAQILAPDVTLDAAPRQFYQVWAAKEVYIKTLAWATASTSGGSNVI
jgi:hypothetical protein